MSLTTKNNKPTSEILSLSLNESALDLLNAAIASHQVKVENASPPSHNEAENNVQKEQVKSTVLHTKRELEKDSQTPTPKRAGRKPLDKSQIPDPTSDPKQKRKAQNRAAQRAFRDRKEKYVSELQARIEELEKLNATKDEDLVKENKRLKEMLQKLQEENHALKGTKFTFEYPLRKDTSPPAYPPTDAPAYSLTDAPAYSLTDTPAYSLTDTPAYSLIDTPALPMNNTDINHFLSHSSSSNNSYSEDASSSAGQSPLSNPHHEDDSASSDTPTTNNTLFSADPTHQFGLPNNNLDFLALGFDDPVKNAIPTADLFHGKDDLFSNYTNNPTSTDDFLAGTDLNSLFGSGDLFGFNMNAQFGLPETPATRRMLSSDKKQLIADKLKQAQKEGSSFYEGYQDIKKSCPDFDLDFLCDELKKKAQCSTYPITETEVNAFLRCMENK